MAEVCACHTDLEPLHSALQHQNFTFLSTVHEKSNAFQLCGGSLETLYLALEVDQVVLLMASATELISEAQHEVHEFPVSTKTLALSCHCVNLNRIPLLGCA